MYGTAKGGCSALVHLLIKHPILAVGLGLAAAAGFLNPQLDGKSIEQVEKGQAFQSKIRKLEEDPEVKKILADASAKIKATDSSKDPQDPTATWFEAIVKTEGGDEVTGVHPDKISHGPAGLTLVALKDVKNELPGCKDLGYDEILNDPELSKQFAHLYFLDLVHHFDDVETAVIAYNNGSTKVAKWIKEGKKLPTGYLNKVKRNL